MKQARTAANLALFLLASLLPLAQPVANAEQKADSPRAAGWLLPGSKEQMDMDPELIPIGRGAIFVPVMSESSAEPPYLVQRNGEVIDRTPMGKKTILRPGKYSVLVGSGVESQMLEHEVEVFEGHCALVEPDWAGMLVHVVDERSVQIRGSYEIFALPSGEDFGLGLGADESRGESLRTWLLRPGRYILVRAGETPRARSDFVTVLLLPGELVQFTLVQDQTDGHFMGGGVVDRWEGKTEIKNWRLGFVVGGDLLFNHNDHAVGVDNGSSVAFNAFLDWTMRYLNPHHLAYLRLQTDEGQSAQVGQDLRKITDEMRLDALYTYRLLSWLGPYVRFGLDTNLFPGKKFFEQPKPGSPDQTVVILDPNLQEDKRLTNPKDMRLADPFDPLELKEGAGVAFDVVPSLLLDLHFRLGFGSRQYLVRSLVSESTSAQKDQVSVCREDNTSCFVQASSSNLIGAEATLIASARLFRWLMIDTELDSLIPVLGDTKNPIINLRNTVSLRLISFASLAYVVKLDYNKLLNEFLQVEQRLLLRFTFDIL